MSEELKKEIKYAVVCVNEFAKRNSMSPRAAFTYLFDNQGIHFLKENYEIEHTLSLDDAIDDLEMICRKNGGVLA